MNSSWPTKKLGEREMNDLIIEGVNITRRAQEGDALYSDNQFLVDDVHRQFVLWRIKVREFVSKYYRKGIDVFFEADKVPDFKGGIEYGDVKSKKSQTLLRNIRVEASKKMNVLRQLQRGSEKWWEKTWVQIIIFLGAIAGIIGLISFFL